MDLATLDNRLRDLLGPCGSAVAITFASAPPTGVKHVGRRVPSSCTFWKLAADGAVFYTEPSDHQGCPIGAHTHGLPLEPGTRAQLATMLGTMVALNYVRETEIADIPTLEGGFRYAVYAPLGRTPTGPDLVILRGGARQMMLAAEAARAAGFEMARPMRERPTCSMIAEVMHDGRAQTSFACIGNRVYTELGDGEVYFAVPGSRLEAFAEELARVSAANRTLEAFHRSRLT